MGSKSDAEVLRPCLELLREFSIPHEARIVSAHRTPDWLFQYADAAEPRGLKVIIAAAGGAAHLPGMLAAKTILPVLGVPVPATCLRKRLPRQEPPSSHAKECNRSCGPRDWPQT